jgi:hypothetical protein
MSTEINKNKKFTSMTELFKRQKKVTENSSKTQMITKIQNFISALKQKHLN